MGKLLSSKIIGFVSEYVRDRDGLWLNLRLNKVVPVVLWTFVL